MSGKGGASRFPPPNDDPDSMLFPDDGEREILESLEGASVQVCGVCWGAERERGHRRELVVRVRSRARGLHHRAATKRQQ